ncbi:MULTISPECIES: efflux RND transporter permease subunit [unclassified Dehalobacter]|uniref:efflux RND transporter permease subunit n=1 Tax=unclassified Dehalobacter TaxID=2635733 RepID=UPI000E6C263C|nr:MULTISPECIES: efflux RND transporter permease subunit [unclassified Dehalobacter]RJE47632.1 multidrug ABC transporter [Dehalobacter sp. MCB1]TCX53873.1 multidrug ABC transporter [Dehalobacter sp. 14DCB1]
MRISETSVKRPVTVLMLVFIVIILGFVSFTRIPLDLMPEMELPYAIVSTSYNGAGPQEIETLITQPIEQAVSTAQNVKNISSITSEGSSLVILEFNYGVDMDQVALDLREKIDLIKNYFPDGVSNPMVLKINMNSTPVLTLSISSPTMSLSELQTLAEDTIQPRLERAEGVASVSVTGGTEDIIEIRTKSEKLAGYGISLAYLQGILASENVNLPGGTVKKGTQELTVKTTGEFTSVAEIEQLLIPLPTGVNVQLKDLADIELKADQQTTIAKADGNPGVNISIQKRSDANTVKVAEAAYAEIDKIQNELEGVKITVVTDNAAYIKSSLYSVAEHGVIGALLAVLVLYIFLRNIRSTLIIASSIPISIIATFCLLYFTGITLNLMTLGGLMLGIGRLVDDSVVVLENIYRFRQNGYSRVEAAVKGSSEVIIAVMASTLTTVAVFLPIVFVQGLTSTLFRQFALTIAFSLGASLVVSMTVVPMLASKLLKVERKKNPDGSVISGEAEKLGEAGELGAVEDEESKGLFRTPAFLTKAHDQFDKGYEALLQGYKKLLKWALSHRKRVFVITTMIFVVSVASIAAVGTEFFPTTDEGMVSISVTLPDGAKVDDTVEIMRTIETKIADIPEIDTIFLDAGSAGTMSLTGAQGNVGTFTVKLLPLAERKRGVVEISDEIRNRIMDVPGAKTSVTVAQSVMSAGDPISITIKGEELDQLKQIGDDFVKEIKKIPGTREVKSSYEDGIPEVEISVDRQAASQYGLSAGTIATAVKASISGVTATQFKYNGTKIDVKIKGDETFNRNLQALEQIPISTSLGYTVTLGQVADISVSRGPVSISRDNQVRTLTISGQISGRDVGSVSSDIQAALAGYQLPDNYTYEMGGQQQEMVDAFSDLYLALGLAVILVYMVMASQFESLVYPFVIMFSIPLGFAGAFLGLFITGKPLSIMSIIGIIMLAGIVVSNAIVLVDYINTRRKTYNEDVHEAIVNAGPIRLRPIIMTTLTTVLAMLPLSLGIGEGSEYQAPMAIVVITGLLFSTLVTLVLIPVMYSFMDDLSNKFKRKFRKDKKTNIPFNL